MKRFLRRGLSLLLALTLVCGLTVPAAASDALGWELTQREILLHRDTIYTNNVFWSDSYSDLRTENYVTYKPNSAVTPIVTFGGVLRDRISVTDAASQLEGAGYRVVAGINGDFYNSANGLPVGMVITGGQLRSSDGGYHAIGFKSDGTAILGKPAVKISLDLGYRVKDSQGNNTQIVRQAAGVNKARVSDGGIYVYTYDFNAAHTNGATEKGVDVVCSIKQGELAVGGTLTLKVEKVLDGVTATPVGENQVVLSVNLKSNSYYVDALRNVPVGSTVTLTATAADSRWNSVEYAVGALYSLVEDGKEVSDLSNTTSPRTAVGQKADGTLIFYTIDGRQSGHSVGASLSQVARRLIELGCETAVCLDGGGSTTMAVTMPDSVETEVVNRPSDGSERAVSNQIFLVAKNRSSTQISHFYVSPSHQYVLAGSKVEIHASAVDTNYIPSTRPYSLSASAGTMEGNVLTTPSQGGEITVTAAGGSKRGSATVYAVADPEHVAIRNSSGSIISDLTVIPGTVTSLTGSAARNHISLKADPEAFTWTVEGNIGTIDQSGNFAAGSPGSGRIIISAGNVNAAINVTVTGAALQTIEDFESGTGTVSGGVGVSSTWISGSDSVQLGKGALRLDYTGLSNGPVMSNAHYAIGEEYSSVNLWVKGDGSQNTLRLLSSDGSTIIATDVCTLESTEWKLCSVTLPSIATSVAGFEVDGVREEIEDPVTGKTLRSLLSEESGFVYVDHLVASFAGTVDQAPPEIHAELKRDLWLVTADVSDAMDDILPKDAITVSYNGGPVEFNYDETAGQAIFLLPGPGESHEAMRITVTAKDASGNLGRASVDVEAYNVGHKFTDIGDYWGATYVDFLYNAGVTTGYGDGTFRPNQNISRAQFAVMLYRYLGLEEWRYADVTLPFADLAQIPGYALPAVRALYSQGIINGSTGSDGKLYFNPSNFLTRAQAAAMIGRTQPKGYASAELTFSDADSIPAYALGFIRTMAAQGILSGYEDGTFRPNNNITRGQMAKILYNLM